MFWEPPRLPSQTQLKRLLPGLYPVYDIPRHVAHVWTGTKASLGSDMVEGFMTYLSYFYIWHHKGGTSNSVLESQNRMSWGGLSVLPTLTHPNILRRTFFSQVAKPCGVLPKTVDLGLARGAPTCILALFPGKGLGTCEFQDLSNKLWLKTPQVGLGYPAIFIPWQAAEDVKWSASGDGAHCFEGMRWPPNEFIFWWGNMKQELHSIHVSKSIRFEVSLEVRLYLATKRRIPFSKAVAFVGLSLWR